MGADQSAPGHPRFHGVKLHQPLTGEQSPGIYRRLGSAFVSMEPVLKGYLGIKGSVAKAVANKQKRFYHAQEGLNIYVRESREGAYGISRLIDFAERKIDSIEEVVRPLDG